MWHCASLRVVLSTEWSRVPPLLRSLCPTFSAVAMFIDNARWDGVPFLLKAGKALHSKRAEIRVQFRHVPGNLYKGKMGADLDNATNELVRCRGGGYQGVFCIVTGETRDAPVAVDAPGPSDPVRPLHDGH